MNGSTSWFTRKHRPGTEQKPNVFADELATEHALHMRLYHADKHTDVSLTMRTPGNDEELMLGFLWSEGLIRERNDYLGIHQQDDTSITLAVQEQVIQRMRFDRNFAINASCGVCGKAGLESVYMPEPFEVEPLKVPIEKLPEMSKQLHQNQSLFARTGGIHASGLFDLQGNLQYLREDIGRHNALDKVIGAAFLDNRLPLYQSILLLSGRVGFELIQKSAVAGIQAVCAIGAPSSLAVELAVQYRIQLFGFIKENSINQYTD